jgi:hypothetical protein
VLNAQDSDAVTRTAQHAVALLCHSVCCTIMAADRAGHVSRSRIFAEGSVFARRLQEQRERHAHEQQVDAAAQDEAHEPARVTWPELWDAK